MQLEEAAVARWGSLEELEEEKDKRVAKREKKALEKAHDMGTFLNLVPCHHTDCVLKECMLFTAELYWPHAFPRHSVDVTG